jgi:hypothetical protein
MDYELGSQIAKYTGFGMMIVGIGFFSEAVTIQEKSNLDHMIETTQKNETNYDSLSNQTKNLQDTVKISEQKSHNSDYELSDKASNKAFRSGLTLILVGGVTVLGGGLYKRLKDLKQEEKNIPNKEA